MLPNLLLDGMPYDLSEITANMLTGKDPWNGNLESAEILLIKLKELDGAIPEFATHPDNGYWISFVEIMDSNGDWFVPTIQYAFHVFPSAQMVRSKRGDPAPYTTWASSDKIYDLLKIKNTYVRNTQDDNKWKLVHRSHGFPIPEADRVRRGATGKYKNRLSEGSHIWDAVDLDNPSNYTPMGTKGVSYVVSNWIDISSFAFRELIDRDIDPDVGELKMLIQVADMNNFQAAINKEVI